jgi:hypothetical protein
MAANAHGISLERGRLGVVLATIVINVVAVFLLTFAPWPDWRTGAALNIVDNCLLVGFTFVRRDALLGRFLLFGIVVGFCELPADAWLVDYTGTLDYSIGGGPMIWRSPLWMPLAWEVVAVQFGYVGLRLWERFGKTGLLMIGLLGAKLSLLESAADFRPLFATPLPFGLRIDWLSRDEDKSAWVGSHSDI